MKNESSDAKRQRVLRAGAEGSEDKDAKLQAATTPLTKEVVDKILVNDKDARALFHVQREQHLLESGLRTYDTWLLATILTCLILVLTACLVVLSLHPPVEFIRTLINSLVVVSLTLIAGIEWISLGRSRKLVDKSAEFHALYEKVYGDDGITHEGASPHHESNLKRSKFSFWVTVGLIVTLMTGPTLSFLGVLS